MKSLIQFDEFGPDMGFPSMKESFCSSPYKGLDVIVEYLMNGRVTLPAAGLAEDKITGETIPVKLCLMTDGEYGWSSSLPYHVKKYNLRLDPEFEKKVLSLTDEQRTKRKMGDSEAL